MFGTTRWFLGMVMGSAIALSTNCASAQITPDKTLPNNSTIRLDGNIHIIENGTQRGGNLFHSFKEFSVPTGGRAFFNNATDIQNIFSRVTGGSVSNIDGIIKANWTANLFLINPNGIVFGKNASLNVGGSFVGTTANAIQFGNQGFFSASEPNTSALLTVNPSALFYNQIAAGASIQNSSTAPAGVTPTGLNTSGLRVPDGKSLLLVGGDITMDSGRLRAYGGLVELGGLAATGTVGLGVDGNNISLSFPTVSTKASVSLINGANVNVSAAGGGSITVNASNLNITGGSSLIAGIAPSLGSVGAKAGDITLNATGDIKIDGIGSVITNNVQRQSIGYGGNITLSSNSLSLTNGAQLQAITYGQGDAGNVIINATKSVFLDHSSIFSTVGDVFSTPEQRNAIKGNGGNIQITTPQLSLTNGAQLAASTSGQGNAGTIKVNAAANVTISGKNSNYNSGLYVDSQSKTGTAGDIIVTSPRVTLDSSGTLNAQSASGNGGNINLQSDLLIIRRGAQISTTAGTAQAGGNGGNITINATNGFIVAVPNENSDITANAFNGSGGRVQINDLGIDPTQGLVNLPVILVDTKVAQGCYAGGSQAQSEFIITGRGGLPPNPGDPLSTDAVDVGLVTLNPNSENRAIQNVTNKTPKPATPKPIVEATGWVINAKGEVELIANAPTSPHGSWQNPVSCRASSVKESSN